MADKSIKIAVVLTAVDKMTAIVNRANKNAKAAFDFGKSAAVAGVSLAAPLYKAIQVAQEFETKMVDIRKQMEFDTPQNVANMTKQIMTLGRELPLATDQIQDMIAAGLRMGIAEDQVVDFTREVTKMSVAFDMQAGEIADSMGKISNVFKIPIEKIGEFADAINYLDDNTMAKGPELIDVLQRIGGAAKNLDPKNAAALAATMLSLGESPETAGTAINAMVNQLSSATMQASKFQVGISMLGLNSKALQKTMSDPLTAQGGILSVFEKINKLKPEKQTEALIRLFGKDAGPKLMKLAGNVNEYRRQLSLVGGQEKGSMTAEYQKRIASSTAQWQLMKNRLTEVTVKAGTTLIPTFIEVIGTFGKLLDKVSAFIDNNSELVTGIGKAIAIASAFSFGVSALSFAFGGVSKAIAYTTAMIKFLKLGQVAYIATTATGATATAAFTAALKAMNLAFLANPIVLAIAAIAAAAFLIYQYWDPISAFFSNLWSGIQGPLETFKNFFIGIWDKIKGPIITFFKIIKALFLNFTPLGLVIKHWDKLTPYFGKLWNGVKMLFGAVFSVLKFLFLNFTPLGLVFKHWDKLSPYFTKIWNVVKGVIGIAFTGIKNIIMKFTPLGFIVRNWAGITEFFSTLPEQIDKIGGKFFNAGKNIVLSIWKGIKAMAMLPVNAMLDIVKKVREFLPFSPAKTGPLRDIHKIRLIETIAGSMKPDSMIKSMNDVMFKVRMSPGLTRMTNAAQQILTPPAPKASSFKQQSNIVFSPVINLSGQATKADAEKITSTLKQQFSKLMKEHQANQKRIAY